MTPEIISSIDQLKKIAEAIVDAQVLANDYTELKAAPFVISEGIQDAKDSMRSLAAEYLFRHLQLTSAVADWNKQAFPQQRMAERQVSINDKRFPCEHSIFLRTQITTVNS